MQLLTASSTPVYLQSYHTVLLLFYSYKEFKLVYTNAERTYFYAGIYSTVTSRKMKVLVATAGNVTMDNGLFSLLDIFFHLI